MNSGVYNVGNSGMRLLAEDNGLSGEELVLGQNSFGALLSKYGVVSVPSPDDPMPGTLNQFGFIN